MDLFEKQQRIESINEIIKARWFITFLLLLQGFVLKAKYFGGQWGVGWGTDILSSYLKIGIFGAIVCGYNFVFWLLMRRFISQNEIKGSHRFLAVMSLMQIIPDQIAFAALYYFNGTVDTMAFMFFFISLFFAGSLYKTKGIVLTGSIAGLLFTTISIVEYIELIPHLPTYQDVTFFGNIYILRAKIFSFLCYIGIVTLVAAFLSKMIRNRERKLREKSNQLEKQTNILTLQTQELTQAKDQLEGALTRSDIARAAATQARDEMEKANIQLKQKVDELEKFYNVTIGREVRMAELKEEIKELKKKQGKK